MMSSWVVAVGAELLSGGQVQVRAELSDGSFLQLNRTNEDLAHMIKRLVDGFPDDRETPSCRLLSGLLRAQGAELRSDPEVQIVEMNKLLKTIISLSHWLSAEDQIFRPEGDQMIKKEMFRQKEDGTLRQEVDQITTREENQTCTVEDQDFNVFQVPVALSEIMRSNGFCLANTETILFDLTPPTQDVTQSDN